MAKSKGPTKAALKAALKAPRKRAEPDQTTARRDAFVREFLVDLNGTQAAIRAGYSARSASVQAARLLANAKVAAAIEAGKAARAERTGITQERVLQELAVLAFSDIDHYEIDDNGQVVLAAGAPKTAKRAISSLKKRVTFDAEGGITREVELRFWDKPGALKLAGRHVNTPGFWERFEITGKNGDAIEAKVEFFLPENGRRAPA
jgi:phage terminase small subunit